jgi:predicted nucleic acid-binding protein
MGRLIVLDTSILDMAETAGQLARRYRTSHHSIEVSDYLMAAMAHQLGAENPERHPGKTPELSGWAGRMPPCTGRAVRR